MTEQPRLVPEAELIDEGYLRRGVYLVKREGNQEKRFIVVSHGLYEFDGQRESEDEAPEGRE